MTAVALGVAALLSLPFLFLLARRPVLRRLALRNAARRPKEAALVVLGSMLGAAIITGSLVVGDTLDASVRQLARAHLGPVDELVLAADLEQWSEVRRRLGGLRSENVDGVLPLATLDVAAASAGGLRAAPRSQLVGVDFAAARRFGGDERATGIRGPAPGPDGSAVTVDLARALAVGPGEEIDVYAYGRRTRLKVERVLPRRGVAGFWLGYETEARNVLVSPEVFDRITVPSRWPHGERFAPPAYGVAVSNRGGVEGGAALTAAVRAELERRAGGLGAQVLTVKRTALDDADAVGESFAQLYSGMGSFGVLAGLLLLVQLFVMLAAERKAELGMARAVGSGGAGSSAPSPPRAGSTRSRPRCSGPPPASASGGRSSPPRRGCSRASTTASSSPSPSRRRASPRASPSASPSRSPPWSRRACASAA